MKTKRNLLVGSTGLLALLVGIPMAFAAGQPTTAIAYINPDTGAATENRNVEPDSDCDMPDRRDRQKLSAEGGSERNVHVDACLRAEDGMAFDGTATFESRGAGAISACPDPDQTIAQAPQIMNGERVAYLHDHNGDGRNDHCHQTGYQMKDAAGDEEYHVRLNNDSKPGRQRLFFCFDAEQDPQADASGQPDGHGCTDEDVISKVVVRWVS